MSPGLKAARSRIHARRESYIEGVKNGSIPMPAQYDANGNMSAEAKSLAKRASDARWGHGPKVMRKLSSITGITAKSS